jgi:hypothetical protein
LIKNNSLSLKKSSIIVVFSISVLKVWKVKKFTFLKSTVKIFGTHCIRNKHNLYFVRTRANSKYKSFEQWIKSDDLLPENHDLTRPHY